LESIFLHFDVSNLFRFLNANLVLKLLVILLNSSVIVGIYGNNNQRIGSLSALFSTIVLGFLLKNKDFKRDLIVLKINSVGYSLFNNILIIYLMLSE